MMNCAPIVLFVYNRPDHTRRTVEALLRNDLASASELYIFADGPKANASPDQLDKIRQVREYLPTIRGFKTVHITLSEQNKGLANSIVYGVTTIVNQYGRVIVVEDDIVTSTHFLRYLNESLDLYERDDDVICINSFCMIKDAPIKEHTYFLYGADCQGWATWKRGWDLLNLDAKELQGVLRNDKKLQKLFTYNDSCPYMDMLQYKIDGKIDSWAICWYASAVTHKKLCLYPTKSLLQNIGYDDSGTHTQNSDAYEASIMADESTTEFPKIAIKDSRVMRKEWEKMFRKLCNRELPPLWKRILLKLKIMIHI